MIVELLEVVDIAHKHCGTGALQPMIEIFRGHRPFRAGQALVLARQKAWWLAVEGGRKSPGQPGFRFVPSKNAARTVEFHRDVKHLSGVQDYLLNVLKGDILREMTTPDLFRHDRNVDNAKPLERLSDTRRNVVQ
ncbi:MAG: hypothetical protein EOS54_16980 [Mesorhizobium sp.]|uniref:hypothetical protein n=1 Tax=unclassified Mesorhizobium TaxID=325217 RepID=UPI000F763D74|nr:MULTISPECIES: hypothetical protein [unclassified Mesorhizobium]AZO48915.1 hypothetical protein EJ073_14770 [Mesorhizobium sp. M4B.F.Ca.ET.058.02.1.1]RVD44164.1 hypothetical protein EN742_03130 [Mesorhizobium sp. M4A.F.Ca.ET.020.02.1.1]RWC22576.1 MAG: hypothetical protein EOS53_01615 [Mesorhizobium sp.]RWC52054.1 MAG: hypothetical protein EOS54_16980 [Mesorhizobium sp.]TIW36853.1 MAG: hypothetical protein E5V62_04785 [Mesorhizobium sp.]